jgi:hypothetical protein
MFRTVMSALVAAMSLTLTLTTCGASSSPSTSTSRSTPTTGTLTGRVTAGPTCPVERPDQPCPPVPVSATIEVKTSQGQIVASTHTDAAGRYLVKVRPGAYTVVASAPNALPSCEPVDVTVGANQTTRAPISCDTGIR